MLFASLLHGDETFSWTDWTIHPSILIGCLLWVGAYLYAIGPLRRKYNLSPEPVEPIQIASFVGGTVLLFLSLNGPLHDLSDKFLFSAHMVQHLIITLLVPPLWLMALPAWLIRPVLKYPAVNGFARTLNNPLIAFAIYNIVFITWHFPFLYNGALENHALHVVQHVMFIAAATIMWYPVVRPVPELARMETPVRLLYIFAFSIPMSIVSALITLAPDVLYPWYAASPRLFGMDVIEDQQAGGLIMWVPGMGLFWVSFSVMFFRWSRREDREEAANRALYEANSTR